MVDEDEEDENDDDDDEDQDAQVPSENQVLMTEAETSDSPPKGVIQIVDTM